MKTIHLYASLGNRKKTAAGGGQTSARRLVEVLVGMGYDVQIVNRMVPPYTSESLGMKLYKYIGYFIDPFRWYFHLIRSERKGAVTLSIIYGGKLFPFYFLFVKISKWLNFKSIIYLKGAFTKEKYASLSSRLKESFRAGMSYSDVALFEGLDGEEIAKQILPEKRFVWLPNYIENDFMPKLVADKPTDTINMMYFGRIDPGKNVLMIIDIFDTLCKKYENLRLSLIGSGDSNYTTLVEERINRSVNKDKILKRPRIEHNELKNFLPRQHYFIFPTESEGHSNALTEAMAYGVVPIASRKGFNAVVVGNDRIIVDEMKVDCYVETIIDIMESGITKSLSNEMHDRVQKKFSQSIIENKLKEAIEN